MVENIKSKKLTCDVCGHVRIIEKTEELPKRCANRDCQSTKWDGSSKRSQVSSTNGTKAD